MGIIHRFRKINMVENPSELDFSELVASHTTTLELEHIANLMKDNGLHEFNADMKNPVTKDEILQVRISSKSWYGYEVYINDKYIAIEDCSLLDLTVIYLKLQQELQEQTTPSHYWDKR